MRVAKIIIMQVAAIAQVLVTKWYCTCSAGVWSTGLGQRELLNSHRGYYLNPGSGKLHPIHATHSVTASFLLNPSVTPHPLH